MVCPYCKKGFDYNAVKRTRECPNCGKGLKEYMFYISGKANGGIRREYGSPFKTEKTFGIRLLKGRKEANCTKEEADEILAVGL